ncbi:LacI family DNA-binding transcriptional regulator [Rathayibacter sp. YIM 133350]|uniref:LacI family DNA-binding transcriptional regulator n=1 Tax=Rathayibacter sp. YIM 133350 TaxID=3131992 RepID=UPI00307CEBEC
MTGTEQAVDDLRGRAVTMFDVARLAGVSHQTVSRVLNDLPGVKATTRIKVEHAIAQLNYVPSPAARTLASRRSRTIGLIQGGRPDYGPSNAAMRFNEAARAADYTVSQASMQQLDPASLREAVHMMVRQNAAAIVLIAGERAATQIIREIELTVPLVTVASEAVEGMHRVGMDQYAGARAAVEHLIGLGHRDIAHLAGPEDSMDASERVRAWRDTLAAHGLRARQPLVGDWGSESGYRLGGSLALEPPSAVFAANDQMALGVLHALRDGGLSVPADVSVIGFDDIPEAAHFWPPLTTMRQDFDGLGHDIMAEVLDVLADEQGAIDRTRRVAELVVRESTAPSRTS